jgi:glycine oxidase
LGVLSISRPRRSAWGQLLRLAHEGYDKFVGALEAETGLDTGFRRRGALYLDGDSIGEQKREKLLRAYREGGIEAEWLARDDLAERVPNLPSRFGGAFHVPAEAVVDPAALVNALVASCCSRGVRIFEGAGQTRLRAAPSPTVELASGEVVTAAIGVVTAGAWSSDLLPSGQPEIAPVRPIRGQAMEVHLGVPAGPNLHFWSSDCRHVYHVIARGEGRVWFGSTVEDVGFDAAVSRAGRAQLLGALREFFPAVEESDIRRTWAGLRPQALRPGGPFLGRVPAVENLWVATGHYRSGILTGPVSAELLARAIDDAKQLTGDEAALLRAFAPQRGEGRGS